MEILIRAVPHEGYKPIEADAISCTYNMDGFTPMNAVLSQLGLDREHFRKCAYMHESEKFKVISHGDEKPFVITTTKTECWNCEANAIRQIMVTADAERSESLCMTHFAFISGKFPEDAFAQCMREIAQTENYIELKKIVVDIDSRYFEEAKVVHRKVMDQKYFADSYQVSENCMWFAERGHPDYQLDLAAELLVKNDQKDRCVHAMKWLYLAALIRPLADEKRAVEPVSKFLYGALSTEQLEQAQEWANEWLEKTVTAYEENPELEMLSEFKAFMDRRNASSAAEDR